jgi:hypothetical protein
MTSSQNMAYSTCNDTAALSSRAIMYVKGVWF